MSPRAQQSFGAVGVENGARIHLGGDAERNAGREVGLDQSGDHIDRRPLRCQHQVNANGARHLGQARDRFFHVARVQHHQVGQLVDDDDDVGQRPVFGILAKQAARAFVVEQLVVLLDVAHAFFSQQFQAAFHLAYGIAQRIGGQLGLGDDRREEMRHAFVVAQFQPLGIDQDQPHLIGRGLVQDGHDHGVDGHALARAGRARDQQVGHAGEIGGDDASVDVLAQRQRQLRFGADELGGLDVFAQPDDFALAVRHLNADRGLARHALDQNALGFQRQAEVVGEIGDAAVLDAGFGLELECRDHRAGIDLRHLSVDVELRVLFREHLGQQLQFVGVDRLLLVGTMQQAAGRQLEAAGRDARHGRLRLGAGVGALRDFNVRNDGLRNVALGRRFEIVLPRCGSAAVMRSMPVARTGSGARTGAGGGAGRAGTS